jgi:hypothetical protein
MPEFENDKAVIVSKPVPAWLKLSQIAGNLRSADCADTVEPLDYD